MRWRLKLVEYDFKIVLRAEIKHQAADAISSLHTNGSDRIILEDYIPVIFDTWSNKQALNFPSIDAAAASRNEVESTLGNDPPTLLKFIEAQ